MDMVLNPYELLGVTPNSSSQEVRKRYYALACLCHPDRGGTNDQMQTLHHAYKYVITQVALNADTTLEALETDFADFCKSQTATPPPFVDIHAEAFNLPRFNELFDLHGSTGEMDGAFLEGGYSTVPSDVTMEYSPTPPDSADATPFKTEMVVYKEPMPVVKPTETVRDLTNPIITDFSCSVGAVQACDYRAALSPPTPIPCAHQSHHHNVLEAFEHMVQLRKVCIQA